MRKTEKKSLEELGCDTACTALCNTWIFRVYHSKTQNAIFPERAVGCKTQWCSGQVRFLVTKKCADPQSRCLANQPGCGMRGNNLAGAADGWTREGLLLSCICAKACHDGETLILEGIWAVWICVTVCHDVQLLKLGSIQLSQNSVTVQSTVLTFNAPRILGDPSLRGLILYQEWIQYV